MTQVDDITFIKLNLPDGASRYFAKNGASLSLDEAIAAYMALPEVASNKYLCLYQMWLVVEAEERLISEQLGSYGYQRDTTQKRSAYWLTKSLSGAPVAPTVIGRRELLPPCPTGHVQAGML